MAEAARKPRDTFPVTVNYDLSVEAAIGAGNYQAVHTDINARNFPARLWSCATSAAPALGTLPKQACFRG